jgi:prepilin-type N-terminal cleavage/methylation domain-containing protein
MSLNKFKAMKSEKGFTIVELLIVIVIIGILAAIVIVAYNGITAKANSTKAQTNAASVQKVAEAFNADKGYYPPLAVTGTDALALYSGTASVPNGVTIVKDAATSPITGTNGLTTVAYACFPTCTGATGGRITYWKFDGTAQVQYIYLGAAKSTDTFAYPAT